MKKTSISIILIVGVLSIAVVGCGNNKGPDFQAIYDEYCDSVWATVGTDGSYLSIDTNPFDEDDNSLAYPEAATAILEIDEELGLPESLYNDMSETTALMGKQSETFSDAGVIVSWSYHPDNGLEVTYKLANE